MGFFVILYYIVSFIIFP